MGVGKFFEKVSEGALVRDLRVSCLSFDDNFYWNSHHQGWRQEFSDRGADSTDEGANIRLSGYCKCQKSPTK